MTPARPETAVEPMATSSLLEIAVTAPAVRLRPVVRSEDLVGQSSADSLGNQEIGLRRMGKGLIPRRALDAGCFGVRLVDFEGRAGDQIALLSVDVAGALREIRSHSPEVCGFELWREGRLILRFHAGWETAGSRPSEAETANDPG